MTGVAPQQLGETLVAVVGGGGQLGQALAATVPPDLAVESWDRAIVDITQRDEVVRAVQSVRPHVIINCAAYSRVDEAETNPAAAWAVNLQGPTHLAEAACAVGARLIHLSTDFVFDGRASTPYQPGAEPHPVSVYGTSKLAGERVVMATAGSAAVVVRTAWLYSRVAPNFVLTMLLLMQKQRRVQVVADQVGSPTWAVSLARVIWGIVMRPSLKGIFHWADMGVASWYDLAVAISDEASSLGLIGQDIAVEPIASDALPRPARRPSYSVLDSSQTREAIGLPGEHWRHNLSRMLEDYARG